jgi:hypothetical protein
MKFDILTAEGKKSDRKSNSHNTYELLLLGKSVEILDRTTITNYNSKFNNRQSIMQSVLLNIYYVIVVASVLITIDIRGIHILFYVLLYKMF